MSKPDDALSTAIDLTIVAARLIRWLRAVDPSPAFSPAQASAMAVVVHSGGITPSLLASHEGVKRPTMSRLLDELVALGVVERNPHPDDHRSSIVRATEHGVALWLAGQDRRARPLAERIAALTDEERALLQRAMALLQRVSDPNTVQVVN